MVASPQYLTPEDYLQFEAKSLIKHEYFGGKVSAMAGARDRHVTLTGNLGALLRNHVRGTGCRVYISAMKARIEARDRFYYPDVMVTCDPHDQETSAYKRFPKVVVEVLSSSTEAFDRGDKFADYQTLESLEEYVLINTRHQRVECFRRNEAGLWVLQYFMPETAVPKTATFCLKSIGFTATIAALYEDVTLEQAEETSDL
ncbi:Uma2 family endonuclease [Nodosilinea sp. FACHB-131]|uniref:Uma2 family endonuclease n=1 Tax=Cyanophyceae TaxID=3028117 RepID=UPI0016867CB7|nr:Uma2 family endonuclease [Nodosilinea sp. FACHB-131]MBD1872893.1 Uma2 family endonuclease [Nodosilinea sp. FACHB-131]